MPSACQCLANQQKGKMSSAEELLCKHCGFVFWVEETLARHCHQFHEEEERKLLEEEESKAVKVVTKKRKRKAVKEPSSRVKKNSDNISTTFENDKILKEKETMMMDEDEQNLSIDKKPDTTETTKTIKASIIQHMHMASSKSTMSPASLPPEILKILPRTTKISLVADISVQLSKGMQNLKKLDDHSSKRNLNVNSVNQKEKIVLNVVNQNSEENPDPKIIQRVSTQKCYLCDARFTSKARLSEHIGASHNYNCGHCKKYLQSMEQLKNHLQLPHLLVCRMCPKTKFVTAEDEAKHLLDIHFSCRHCKVTFNSKVGIEEHMSIHHNSCDICENFFHWAEPGHTCFYTISNSRPHAYRIA